MPQLHVAGLLQGPDVTVSLETRMLPSILWEVNIRISGYVCIYVLGEELWISGYYVRLKSILRHLMCNI